MKLQRWVPGLFYLTPSAWITLPLNNPHGWVFVFCFLKWGFSIEHNVTYHKVNE
jgi:hypothetical protein